MFPGDPIHEESKRVSADELTALYSKVSRGVESQNALRILGDLLNGLNDAVTRSMVYAKPDPLEYAKAAGALWVIESIRKNLLISKEEGIEAQDLIKLQGGKN